jgi:hypothetical protein
VIPLPLSKKIDQTLFKKFPKKSLAILRRFQFLGTHQFPKMARSFVKNRKLAKKGHHCGSRRKRTTVSVKWEMSKKPRKN